MKRKDRKGQLLPQQPTELQGAETTTPQAASSSVIQQSRRRFLGDVGSFTAAALAAGVIEGASLAQEGGQINGATDEAAFLSNPVSGPTRAQRAYEARLEAAIFQNKLPLPEHPHNGDEELYPNKIGNFSKGLPHNALGEVELAAYATLKQAVQSGEPADFERITLGGQLVLKNPQSGLALDLVGPDPAQLYQPPAPAFASAEEAAEMAEVYWMALCRDVNFLEYDTHPLTSAAAEDLSRFTDFRGPRLQRLLPSRAPVLARGIVEDAPAQQGAYRVVAGAAETAQQQPTAPLRQTQAPGRVTPGLLFRGHTPGDLTGPYISQFLWKDTYFGAQPFSLKMRTTIPGDDYLTTYGDWLAVQNGAPRGLNKYDPTPRYIRNLRDLAEWVHIDVLFQAYFQALLTLFDLGAPFDQNNPYVNSRTQDGFGTFGPPHIAAVVCGVASSALRAVWYQKWFVHRRLRPEEFGGRVHNHVIRAANYPIHNDLLRSQALVEINRKNGNYLLPQAFPEGCPPHPAYGAGHATVAGACTTILKAWFDESWVIPNPVVPTPDGLALTPYRGGATLTVGGELNKLANNVALGRNAAGVHWRSDATESLKLGEAVAIGILTDFKHCYNERFDGFSLTKFDGTRVTIG
jgi:hypothetical protein